LYVFRENTGHVKYILNVVCGNNLYISRGSTGQALVAMFVDTGIQTFREVTALMLTLV
jgi:hypothetical protein